jgi:hypothetical protein
MELFCQLPAHHLVFRRCTLVVCVTESVDKQILIKGINYYGLSLQVKDRTGCLTLPWIRPSLMLSPHSDLGCGRLYPRELTGLCSNQAEWSAARALFLHSVKPVCGRSEKTDLGCVGGRLHTALTRIPRVTIGYDSPTVRPFQVATSLN